MLLPPKPNSSLAKMMQLVAPDAALPAIPPHSFWSPVALEVRSDGDDSSASNCQGGVDADLLRKRSWRIDEPTLSTFRGLLNEFTGTHCFHNYTVGRDFSDRAAQRFMMKLEARDPKVLDDGTEWISVSVHGQSFMLHQVRCESRIARRASTWTGVAG